MDRAQRIGTQGDETIASLRSLPTEGRAIYSPSPIGMGAWLTDAASLAQYLHDNVLAKGMAFSLQPQSGCLLRTLRNEANYVTVLTNGNGGANRRVMRVPAN